MGIKNLNVFLRKNCPKVFEEIHISEYAYKKVAIDTSLFLCKYKAIYGDKWLVAFINLVSILRKNEIHCVFIYDNGSPPEKEDEKAERVRQREKNKERVYELELSLEKYYNNGEIDDNLLNLYSSIKEKPQKRLFSDKIKIDSSFDIKIVTQKIDKMRSNILNISEEDFTFTEELFSILNIPFYKAPLEAETTCADLCKRGIVDAVLSEDTDVLAYSCPVFLTKIDTINETCVRVQHKDILKSLELEENQFLDLCIMCGCDYNKNIPKVGPENAFKYLKKYNSIEGIESNMLSLDTSILKYVRTRELFKNYKQIELNSVPFCGFPDFDKLKDFISKQNIDKHIELNFEKIKKNFTHNNIVIEYEVEEVNDNKEVADDNKEEVVEDTELTEV
jgi:5'-3' exonuclease